MESARKDVSEFVWPGRVTQVIDPHYFWMQLGTRENLLQFEQLQRDMQVFASQNWAPATSIDELEPGMVVLVETDSEQLTCLKRGQIARVMHGNSVDVFYVDYGNTELKTIDKICINVPTKFKVCPPQAVRCSLAGVKPLVKSWTSRGIKTFQQLTADKLLNVLVLYGEPGYCEVALYQSDGGNGRSVGHSLVAEEVAMMMEEQMIPEFLQDIPTFMTQGLIEDNLGNCNLSFTTNAEEVCVICKVKDDNPTAKLGEKGCASLLTASKNKGDNLSVSPGQVVHQECRKVYCHPNQLRSPKNKSKSGTTPNSKTRSEGRKFSFETKCIFCGNDAKQNGNKRGNDVFPVRTLDFQTTIKEQCKRRCDEWGNSVLCRLEYVNDLPAAEARYHQVCSINFRTGCQIPNQHQTSLDSVPKKKGRPSKDLSEDAFLKTMQYFETCDNEQVTVSDLVAKMGEFCVETYSTSYMKKKIIDYFDDAIIISAANGKRDVVTFKSTAHSILHSFYKRNGKDDSDSERQAIIKTAAKLIFSDIKSNNYSKEVYPTGSEIMSSSSNLEYVPDSLQVFLNHIIDNKQGEKKISSIGQAIVQAAIPRGVITPLQIGLAVQVHHLFGSRHLVETLNSLGFCSSYQEVLKFESSAAVVQGTTLRAQNNEFVQYMADYVDHNICTLDGSNTFHGMGIIATITPKVETSQIIPRIKVTREDVIDVGKIEIYFYKQKTNNMEEMIFRELADLNDIETPDAEFEFLIKITRPLKLQFPGWSGIMQMVQNGTHPGESSIMFMPMIDMSASDMSCIYSTLHFVALQSKSLDTTPVLTFDQPLYWKALSIVTNEPTESKIKSVVLRLGGFHTEVSFRGCIGRVMENSGLKELLETIYAENTVGHMLSGKAVNRAVRGHFLVDDALHSVLFTNMKGPQTDLQDLNNNPLIETDPGNENEGRIAVENDIYKVKDIMQTVLNEKQIPDTLSNNSTIQDLMERYENVKANLTKFKTARLWLQYMEMVDILKLFLKAERMGNWSLHLNAIQKMLPVFASAGHNLYLKSAYVYLQQMLALPDNNPKVHEAFCDGYHVVRRCNRYWGGLSTDLMIEQVLMRSVKSVGGLTRGRGMTESQRAHWLLSVPATAEINRAMQDFTDQKVETSEQHKESTEARIERDEKDRNTLEEFLNERNPFSEESHLRNIETGVIADKNVNADIAKEVGQNILKAMKDQKISDFSFKRKNQVVTMGTKESVKVNGEELNVDPQLLFQRLITVADSSLDDVEDMFKYELSGNLSSLFEPSGLLREAQKPLLANSIWEQGVCGVDEILNDNIQYVLDGGSLIQKIPWTCGETFNTICLHYTDYVLRHYGKACVVFDGYGGGASTKDVTHERRTKGIKGAEIKFEGKTPFKTKKMSVLSNVENKQRFINLLCKHMEEKEICVVNAESDADVLIVETAVKSALNVPTVVVGEDTDLLILLCYHTDQNGNNMYFTSDPKNCLKKKKIWDIKRTQNVLGIDNCRLLPFVHAFSGCDTTSRIFSIGKGVVFKKCLTDTQFKTQANVFISRNSSHDEIEKAGEQSFKCVYNGKKNEKLDSLRYRKFITKTATGTCVVQVKTLPPTQAAGKYHSFRVYQQVQTWIGHETNPLEWGWCKASDRLVPIKTDLPAAPERLLKVIKCNCKTNCDTKRCSCRKHGLVCSSACGDCKGIGCSNSVQVDTEEFEET